MKRDLRKEIHLKHDAASLTADHGSSYSSFADAIYRVRTSINSWVDKELTHTTLYKKRQQEGRTNRSVVVDFD